MQKNCRIRILSQIDTEKKLYNLDGVFALCGNVAKLTYFLDGGKTTVLVDEKGVKMTREGDSYIHFHFRKEGRSTGKIGLSKTESGKLDVQTENVTSEIIREENQIKSLAINLKYAISFIDGESQKTELRLLAEVK